MKHKKLNIIKKTHRTKKKKKKKKKKEASSLSFINNGTKAMNYSTNQICTSEMR